MNWYKGGIAEAITASRKNNSIFVVYVQGDDDKSKKFAELIEREDVYGLLGSSNFTPIKVEANSVTHQQFSEIYKDVPVPSIFFFGKAGVPLLIVRDAEDGPNLISQITSFLLSTGRSMEGFLSAERSDAATPKGDEGSINSEGSATVSTSEVISSTSTEKEVTQSTSTELTPDEKVVRARELLEKKRDAKKSEEEQIQKDKEIERRKMGQDVQKLKKWQQEQELKNILEAREREKQEEKKARQRVLDQIKQDKADRASRFSNSAPAPQPEVSSPSPPKPPRVPPNRARLQFKLPDGSTKTNDFESSATLIEVRNYVSEIMHTSVHNFTLSTTFPRREFTSADNLRTLIELELIPNAVILVLPLSQGTVSTANNNFFVSLFWSFITPILNLFNYLKSFVTGSAPGTSEAAGNGVQSKKRAAEPAGEPSRNYKKKSGESTVHRQGNVHRLHDKTDSDEDNNTWNGNSTQQM